MIDASTRRHIVGNCGRTTAPLDRAERPHRVDVADLDLAR